MKEQNPERENNSIYLSLSLNCTYPDSISEKLLRTELPTINDLMKFQKITYLVSIANAKRECSEYVQPLLLQTIFYGDYDITLGQLIERICINRTQLGTDRTFFITHGSQKITFKVTKKNCPLAGFSSTIIVWNSCGNEKCKKTTPFSKLCDDSWKISFSKYLEMLFYTPTDARFRTQICSHDLKQFTRNFSYLDHQLELEISGIQILNILLPRTKIEVSQISQAKFHATQIEEIKHRIHQFYNDLNKSLDRILRLRTHKFHKIASSEKVVVLQKFQEFSIRPTLISKILVLLTTNYKKWNEELNRFVDDYMTTIYSKLGFGYFKSTQDQPARIDDTALIMPSLSNSPSKKSPLPLVARMRDSVTDGEFSFDRLFSGEEFKIYEDFQLLLAPALSLLATNESLYNSTALGVDLKDGKPLQAGDSYKRVSILENLALIWENQPIDFKLNAPLYSSE